MDKLYKFLDKYIFPSVKNYFSHPLVILLTILLFIPMILFSKLVVLILLLNSYMNAGGFGTSQITLREVRLTGEAQEKRSQETHDAVIQELAIVKEELAIAKEQRAATMKQQKEVMKTLDVIGLMLRVAE